MRRDQKLQNPGEVIVELGDRNLYILYFEKKEIMAMHLNIEIPDALAAVVKAQAKEQGVSPDRFVSRVLESLLGDSVSTTTPVAPYESGYGMLAKYGSAPSADEIDENRRAMFGGFGESF